MGGFVKKYDVYDFKWKIPIAVFDDRESATQFVTDKLRERNNRLCRIVERIEKRTA